MHSILQYQSALFQEVDILSSFAMDLPRSPFSLGELDNNIDFKLVVLDLFCSYCSTLSPYNKRERRDRERNSRAVKKAVSLELLKLQAKPDRCTREEIS